MKTRNLQPATCNPFTSMHTHSNTPHTLHRLWLGALALFVLAGATGALLRFSIFAGFPWGLQFSNVRHAHSHLMYFGWVTPALMALIAAYLPQLTQRPLSSRFQPVILLTLLAALLSYGPFLLYGYRSVALFGGAALPLSVMASALNMLLWYAFAYLYWRQTRGAARYFPLRLWDAALIFLGLASLGAWGLPLLSRLPAADPTWSLALTRLFLDTFADGWFVLAALGLLYAAHPAAAMGKWARRGHDWMIIGLPVIFLLGMPTHLLPLPLRLIGSGGGLLVGAGLLGHLWTLWPQAARWRIPLAFLGLKAVTQLILIVPTAARWAEGAGLRIPYLHWLLLGFISLALILAAERIWGETAVFGRRYFTAAVLLLLLTLMPLTSLWPAFLRGRWTLYAAAWAALAPVVVALGMLAGSWRAARGGHSLLTQMRRSPTTEQ